MHSGHAYAVGHLAELRCVHPSGHPQCNPLLAFLKATRDYTAIMDPNPPFLDTYKRLLDSQALGKNYISVTEECELPLIDLGLLNGNEAERCKRDIAAASSDWGFFQVMNHGISSELLQRVSLEEFNVFQQPFEKKASEKLLDFPADSYRWGTPTATSLQQLSWSEAYHIPLMPSAEPNKHHTRRTIEEFAVALSQLAHQLAGILAEGLGREGIYFEQNCTSNTCYLRLNRYPPCPIPGELFGLVPHTDSDFLTILYQDKVGGLQLMKNGRWIAVKPNPGTLIINIGDLFEAWSNGVYKSVEHRVMSNPHLERFSAAYFLCPSYDTIIQTQAETAIYRKFSFGEYRQKVQEDVRLTGRKVGLSRFLA